MSPRDKPKGKKTQAATDRVNNRQRDREKQRQQQRDRTTSSSHRPRGPYTQRESIDSNRERELWHKDTQRLKG